MFDLLCNEIIRQIIRYAYVFQPISQVGDPSRCHVQLPPVVASHVCRSWRNALLSDPTMWTCIRVPQMNPDGIKEMLHRSAPTPLDVFIDTSRRDYPPMVSAHLPDILSLLFEHIRRFETLYMELIHTDLCSVAELVEQVLPYLSRPAPLLQSFSLHVEEAELFEHEAFVQTLFSGHAPNLKHVYRQIVVGFHEVLRSPLFQNLSSLHFSPGTSRAFYFDSFLDVLELSPELTTFEAAMPFPLVIVPPTSSNRRVGLSNLRRLLLRVSCSADFLDLFVDHVTFPRIEYCRISCIELSYRNWKSAPSLRSFIRRYPMPCLAMSFTGEGAKVVFSRSRFMKTDSFIEYECNDVSKLKHMGTFLNLVYTCDLSYITRFWISPAISLRPKMLRTLLAFMVNLELLGIMHVSCPHSGKPSPSVSVLTALIPLFEVSETGTEWETSPSITNRAFNKITYMFPCASLRELVIKVVEDAETYMVPLGAEYASMLRVVSDSRREHGYPLEKITIQCSESSLTEEAEAILEPQGGFPVKLVKCNS